MVNKASRLLLSILLLIPVQLFAQEMADADLENGHAVYDLWCAPCHAAGPKHPGTQALSVLYRGSSISAVLEERTDLTVERISSLVRSGVSIMAPFRKTEISDDDLFDMAVYLSTAAEQNEMQ